MFGGEIGHQPGLHLRVAAARSTPDGYVVEVRIPFKTPALRRLRAAAWGLQVERKVQRTGYTRHLDGRAPGQRQLPRCRPAPSTGLHDLRRGVVIEAQPFVTAAADGARDARTGTSCAATWSRARALNLRVAFTNLAIDATVNPDFSQVESDAGQVTVNERFALFFPEKRPFFLEGIDLFATPNQLVYTRQIVDPVAGGKA